MTTITAPITIGYAGEQGPAGPAGTQTVITPEGTNATVFGCVIRPDASGVWSVIDDATHTPIGDITVTQDSDSINVDFGFTTAEIGSVSVTPDETLAGLFAFGPSVGTSTVNIGVKRIHNVGGYLYYSGSSWTKLQDKGIDSMSFSGGTLSVNFTPGLVKSADTMQAQPSARGGYVCNVDGSGDDLVELEWFDSSLANVTTASNALKARLTVPSTGEELDPSVITIGAYPLCNIWITGIMKTP